MTVWRTVTACALGASLTALICAPAAWLAQALAKVSDEHVLLGNPSGTIWSGSAQLTLAGGAGSQGAVTLPTRVHWQLSPQWYSLGLAKTQVRLSSQCCTPSGALALEVRALDLWRGNAAGLVLQAPALNLPATVLSGLGAPWNTLKPEGQVRLEAKELAWWNRANMAAKGSGPSLGLQGQASVTLEGFATALSTVRPLGTYSLALNGSKFSLHTQGAAPLQLQGSGELVGAHIRFSGEALAAPGQEAALANLLHIIGQREDRVGANGKTQARARLELNL